MTHLRIGRAAALAGVSVDTVRFYERRGLLPRAPRERSGYRQFDGSTVERIRLIRVLADLGLGLDEIAAMLDALLRQRARCQDERPRLVEALQRAEERIAELEAVRAELRAALTRCDDGTCDIAGRARQLTAEVRRLE